MDRDIAFEDEIRDKNNKVYNLTKNLGDDALSPTNTMVRYSLREDSAGKKLTEAQAEFFKGSKVRDEKGRLLEVYHGTNAEFTVFDKSKIGKNFSDSYGGFYFTNKESSARYYAGARAKQALIILTLKTPTF